MAFRRKKPLNTRFQDTYQFMQTALAGQANLDLNLISMDKRVEALNGTGELKKIVEAMSLGFRWEIKKAATETRRRHYVRAVLLGYATLGDPDQAGRFLNLVQIKAKKDGVEGMTEVALDTLLKRMLQANVQTQGNRTFIGFKTTLEKQNSIYALDQITEAVTRVQTALLSVARVPKEATRFGVWFGTTDPKTIRSNFAKVYNGIQGGVMLIKDDDPAEVDTFGYVYKDGPNDPPRIYLCGAFWRAGRVTWNNVGGVKVKKDGRAGDDNPLGVLLHELTHIFCDTEDHEYGQDDCKQLAIDNPANAADNADNHEYYAESVMADA